MSKEKQLVYECTTRVCVWRGQLVAE